MTQVGHKAGAMGMNVLSQLALLGPVKALR